MKERVLAIINTHSQLIIAIRFRQSLWKDKIVDVLATDQSSGLKEASERVKALNIFDDVFFVENKSICAPGESINDFIKKSKIVFNGVDEILAGSVYNEIVYYNADVYTYGIFATIIKKNPDLVCNRYEEGILSYEDSVYLHNSRLKHVDNLRKILGKKRLEDATRGFYCCEPKLYNGVLEAIKIPSLSDMTEMTKMLGYIYNVDLDQLKIREKYIFFASVYDFEGGEPVGELDLILKIADIVGKENLIVKKHPRDERTVFEEKGIPVYKKSSVPWEAIQFNGAFNDKVFLTINSSAVLSGYTMANSTAKTYFMYKLCDYSGNTSCISTVDSIEKTLSSQEMKEVLKTVKIANKLEDIL